MRRLFEKSAINEMSLKNRFVRAATWEGLATKEGEVTPELIVGKKGICVRRNVNPIIYVSIQGLTAKGYIALPKK